MKRLQAWAMMIAFFAAVCGVLYLWWSLDLRWRPHKIGKHQDEIAKILEGSGWISPGLTGPKLYVIAYRDCADCTRYEDAEFPRLQKAGVDTRVIMIARPDLEGAAQSTTAERATVAELWVNRGWALFQKWTSTPVADWTARGIAPADGDVARSAVVEAGRASIERLTPLLGDNGIKLTYPSLVWWTKDGKMEGCACSAPQTYGFVRKDLGAN
jgi:hypothetical protein